MRTSCCLCLVTRCSILACFLLLSFYTWALPSSLNETVFSSGGQMDKLKQKFLKLLLLTDRSWEKLRSAPEPRGIPSIPARLLLTLRISKSLGSVTKLSEVDTKPFIQSVPVVTQQALVLLTKGQDKRDKARVPGRGITAHKYHVVVKNTTWQSVARNGP